MRVFFFFRHLNFLFSTLIFTLNYSELKIFLQWKPLFTHPSQLAMASLKLFKKIGGVIQCIYSYVLPLLLGKWLVVQ